MQNGQMLVAIIASQSDRIARLGRRLATPVEDVYASNREHGHFWIIISPVALTSLAGFFADEHLLFLHRLEASCYAGPDFLLGVDV